MLGLIEGDGCAAAQYVGGGVAMAHKKNGAPLHPKSHPHLEHWLALVCTTALHACLRLSPPCVARRGTHPLALGL